MDTSSGVLEYGFLPGDAAEELFQKGDDSLADVEGGLNDCCDVDVHCSSFLVSRVGEVVVFG